MSDKESTEEEYNGAQEWKKTKLIKRIGWKYKIKKLLGAKKYKRSK